jgi:hypothetical protein
VQKNDEEFNSLVDRMNSVIDLLRDEAEGQPKPSSKQIEKVCQSFYGYVAAPTHRFVLTDLRGAELLISSSLL